MRDSVSDIGSNASEASGGASGGAGAAGGGGGEGGGGEGGGLDEGSEREFAFGTRVVNSKLQLQAAMHRHRRQQQEGQVCCICRTCGV